MQDPDTIPRAAEALLDDEGLTDDLIDQAARPLLRWGLAQAEALLHRQGRPSQEEIEKQILILRQEIKRISRQAGQAPPEAQAARVQSLLDEIERLRKEEENESTQ